MTEKRAIDKLTIKGFKSLQDVELELGQLNVLIGPNGAGKSNFVSFFHMLRELLDKRLQLWVAKRGGANRVLTYGAKRTPQMSSEIQFDDSSYQIDLEYTDADVLVFAGESIIYHADRKEAHFLIGHTEAKLRDNIAHGLLSEAPGMPENQGYLSLFNWRIYHFHDTSNTARVKLTGQLHDNQHLRSDASNLAAYLYMLKHGYEETYREIVEIVRLAIPFFSDFVLDPEPLNSNSIMLKWRHKAYDYLFIPSQLSDGSLRFICLVTALMQPDPPSTIIIDEPELGLHPHAIHLLGALLRSASKKMQVIVATQSTLLLDEFDVDDLIVVELENGVSKFKRLKESDFDVWLQDFSVGELWDKNVLGGGVP